MGERSEFPGVEQHGPWLRITFTLDGQRIRQPLGWAPTPPNWRKAAQLRANIRARIRAGTYSHAEFFPSSELEAGAKTFAKVASEWLELQHELQPSTLRGYQTVLDAHWLPEIGAKAMRTLSPGDLLRGIKKRDFKSAKTRNNAVSILRLVFAYAEGEGYLQTNPATGIKPAKRQQNPPDPFTLDEALTILDWIKANEHEQHHNYFHFAFFSGVRPSEQIALKWPKVDLRAKTARIDAAKVVRKEKGTKTYRVRDIELVGPALAALKAQRIYTALAGQHVFLNPNTGEPYLDDKPPRKVFTKALKALGIRHRPAYNTRHTYATVSLMTGAKPMWVSRQLGHANMAITLTVYSRWIDGADKGNERNTLDAALGQKMGQIRGGEGREGEVA